jgi:hypothetical protein
VPLSASLVADTIIDAINAPQLRFDLIGLFS